MNEIEPMFIPRVAMNDAEKALIILIYTEKTGATLIEKTKEPLTDLQKFYTILQVCSTIGLNPKDVSKLLKKYRVPLMFNQRTHVFARKR